MEYIRLGTSGLKISRITLGCMSFSDPNPMAEWSLAKKGPRPCSGKRSELGITTWDTANVYGMGTSEEIVGRPPASTPVVTKSFWRRRSTVR